MMTTKAQAIETLDALEWSIDDLPGLDLRATERRVDDLRAFIEQSQAAPGPLPEGWHLRAEHGAVMIAAPDGSGAWYDEDRLKDRIVRELVGALITRAADDLASDVMRRAQTTNDAEVGDD